MITTILPYFKLDTQDLTYLISVNKTGQIEHVYLGKKLSDTNFDALKTKLDGGAGSSVDYEDTTKISLDLITLEYSGIGKGDFRLTPLEIKMPDGTFVTDFVYDSFEIIKGIYPTKELPQAKADEDQAETLILKLKDKKFNMELHLIYTAFEKTNVFSRRAILINHEESEIIIRKIMSLMIDLPEDDYDLITFDGGWIKEAHKHKRLLTYGTYINDSTTGNSSNRHNPGVILAKKGTHEDYGVCFGVNLVYSGNHYEAVQISNHGLLRLMTGINPFLFDWPLKKDESFETPEAIITYSEQGFNQLSQSFHDFVNAHITPRQFQQQKRLVAINSWEAFYFDFNERKLKHFAKEASKLGVELFVLDDGWFGERNDDTKALGDYDINPKKFSHGLKGISDHVHHLGMKFGLWFEPEMVNPNSKLYRSHPEYAIKIEGRTPSLGRHQLVLDLCRKDVRDYIVSSMSKILNEVDIDYIKWDMNRHITDMYSSALAHQGMFFHSYIIGLYDILNQLTSKYPNILIESCSSGGNRYDLGMLSYSPQVWASDNTDPIERLKIQQGLSYLYPQSTISAHVSLAPHAQTIRNTPLATRFNVASFGILGYELNLKHVTPAEKKEIKRQIELYKTYRDVFQYGTFHRFNTENENHVNWQVSLKDTHILGNYQMLSEPSPDFEIIRTKGLNENENYKIHSVQQTMPISQFGHLISHALPIKLNPNGALINFISKHKQLENGTESYEASGRLLNHGFRPKQQFMGTGYNTDLRLLGDYGSQIYIIEPQRKVRS